MTTDPQTDRLHDEILGLRAELAQMRDLLRTENQRANAAIDRETTAEQAALDAEQERDRLRAVVARIAQMADAWEQRLPETIRTPAVVSAIRAALEPAAAVPVAAPPTTEQAAGWLDAAAECNKAGGAYAERGATDAASAAFALMEAFLRKAGEAEYVATPCDFVACEPGGEPCSVHERLMAHAEGDHELCAPDCGSEWQRRLAVEAVQAGGPSRAATEPDTGDDHSCAESGCTGEPTAAEAPHAETPDALPFIHVDDDSDRLEIGTVMASTYDGEAPVVYVAAEQYHGDQVATVYVRPGRVEQVIAALRAARGKAAAPAVSSRPGTEQEA